MKDKTTSNRFSGEKLRLARNFHGITLQELGIRVGATRQYIFQLENDEKNPSEELLHALSDALDVTSTFLTATTPERVVSSDTCHFRKLKTTPVKLTEQVVAHSEMFAVLVDYVEQFVSLPPVDFPSISVSSLDQIEDAAENCRLHWNLTVDEPIVNMTRVVENAGAIVATFVGTSPKIDAFSMNTRRPIIVRSMAKESVTRQRFDIAHECGHLILHKDAVGKDEQLKEDEANRFASSFLLPKRTFQREFPHRKHRLDWKAMFAMKRDWNVSVQAILRRAFDLKLINSAQYRSGNIFLSKQGFRKSEPFEPAELERAELMKLAVETMCEEYRKGLDNVANDLGTQSNFIRRLVGIPLVNRKSGDGVTELSPIFGWALHQWKD